MDGPLREYVMNVCATEYVFAQYFWSKMQFLTTVLTGCVNLSAKNALVNTQNHRNLCYYTSHKNNCHEK